MGYLKTPTVIKYKDESYTTIDSWGYPALIERPKRRTTSSTSSKLIIELFKLHLLLEEMDRPFLPNGLDFRNVIRDYLKKLYESIKESLNIWSHLDLHKNILIVLPVRIKFLSMISSNKREKVFDFFFLKKKLSRFRQNLTTMRSIHYAIVPLKQV